VQLEALRRHVGVGVRKIVEAANTDLVRYVDWKGDPGSVLEVVDEQLHEFGLEIVIIQTDDYAWLWRVEKRKG
jgi:hypothetical protein